MNSNPNYWAIRDKNLDLLEQKGFLVAGNLPRGPYGESNSLRPIMELAKRLWALDALFIFIGDPGKKTQTKLIRQCVSRNGLLASLTKGEKKQLTSWRWYSRWKYIDSVGWVLENMLSLAWILGFCESLGLDGDMLGGELLAKLLFDFIGDLNQDLPKWVANCTPRSELEVIEMEDLFYCAHNAVRGAQGGRNTVPNGFHPIINGGVIHERRHALTWAISPGVAWEETDLST